MAHDHAPHNCIGIIHTAEGLADTVETMDVPPPGSNCDIHCRDCKSVVTLVSNPPACLAGAYVVTHTPDCPWLRSRTAVA
jgi:hypothetical protein